MTIDANDPKWTAYALGEIKVEQERAELESILKESPEMRRVVAEIRSTGELLSQELQAEPAIDLTPAQRAIIEKKAGSPGTWFGFRPAWILGAAAAFVLVTIFAVSQLNRIQPNPKNIQVAQAIPKEPLPAIIQEKPSPPAALAEQAQISHFNASKGDLDKKPIDDMRADSRTPKSAAGNPAAAENKKPEASSSVAIGQSQIAAASPPLDQVASVAGTVQGAPGAVRSPAPRPIPNTASGIVGGIPGGVAGGVAGGVVGGFVGSAGFLPQTVIGGPASDASNDARYQPGVANGVRRYPGAPPPPPTEGRLFPRRYPRFNTELYDPISDNPFLDVVQNPLSTFSIDVDTASYSNMRRYLDIGQLPPKDSIRIEELVNYFDYDYKGPKDDKPFAAYFEMTEAPWNPEHRLLRIALKGREIKPEKRPASNLVFLLDVSGSMLGGNRLPLVKQSMRLVLNQLTEADRVAIVVYATESNLWLPATSGDQKDKIRYAIDQLQAGGTTNGGAGIQLAYRIAQENFIRGGTNRVILATDGDFNVGLTNRGDLTRLIEEKAKSGIYLSALGFGMGNLKDATLEALARNGHGNYAYIDTLNEAEKVLVEQASATLVPIAKDVKIQVEFNPRHVSTYRLIGYEDRLLAKEDFNDDTKDAGVIGAGHAVTALYELAPAGSSNPNRSVDPLKYQKIEKPAQPSSAANSNEVATVKIRSKEPEKDRSVLSEYAIKETEGKFGNASGDFKFAAAVAAFGMVLRDSPHKGDADLHRVLEWAKEGQGLDKHGYRQEFIRLVNRTLALAY
jgi:Ca-activated chloride channel homolog